MQKKIWLYLLFGLLVVTAISWISLADRPSKHLRITACDVGQGDSILVSYGSFQMLIDGGPGNKVMSCLGKHMVFWDRTIEVVVLTHPDADHSTGLVGVVKNYTIKHFLTSGVEANTNVYEALKSALEDKKITPTTVVKGDKMRADELYFEILSPSKDMYDGTKKFKSNNYSLVMKLSFGAFDALLTGDVEDIISDKVTSEHNLSGIEYLKVPHHGSKNGLSKAMFDEVRPEVAVLSLGKNNRFGHPHAEVTELLIGNLEVYRTDLEGDVTIESDGKKWGRVSGIIN